MATRPHGIYNNQSAANYINKKGINELFEVEFSSRKKSMTSCLFQALMTALMVHKPDDHIAFIRECLDKVRARLSSFFLKFFIVRCKIIPLVFVGICLCQIPVVQKVPCPHDHRLLEIGKKHYLRCVLQIPPGGQVKDQAVRYQ